MPRAANLEERMDLQIVVTPGLGDNTYLLVAAGEAAFVDPQRDVDRFLSLAEERGASVGHVLETHVHNDYLTGALEIMKRTGAEIAGPARAGYRFPYHRMAEGDEIRVGDVRLVAMETPGHTPEHVSYLLYEADSTEPTGVFTGGCLMVQGAGRTDLLGAQRTDELTRLQFRSLRRLAALPDPVRVLPTHGAGSFCGTGPAPRSRTSTIGEERVTNPALTPQDEESFVSQQLTGLLAYPTYYRYMAPANRAGPSVLGRMPTAPALTPEEIVRLVDDSAAWIIDARFRVPFAHAHIRGSLNIELDATFGSYVGWVVPFDAPLVLVLPEPEVDALEEAITQLVRIGYERILGYLRGGMDSWRSSGLPLDFYRVAGLEELCRSYQRGDHPAVLDVRQRTEWDEGHIPGSQHIFVGDLPRQAAEVPADREVWAICATGHRASLAASFLEREDVPVRLVDATGVSDFLKHCLPARTSV